MLSLPLRPLCELSAIELALLPGLGLVLSSSDARLHVSLLGNQPALLVLTGGLRLSRSLDPSVRFFPLDASLALSFSLGRTLAIRERLRLPLRFCAGLLVPWLPAGRTF